ncbi:hypothetical protein [Gracilimonas mengyeensis]|nr:hypothetical protein [Gracilimonas mengyeensis]
MKSLSKDSGIWQWAMFSFVLAGLTGFLYRLGLVFPLPIDFSFENIRHGHSHLMFFGWAALLPMYLIKLDSIPGYHAAFGPRLMKASLWFSVVFTLLSYPAFLMWGYQPVAAGEAYLPLSAILSGMVMIGWYGFMIGYLITRYFKKDFQPNIWFESALIMLFISSLGAWGVGFVELMGIGGPMFGKALTHFFLATFMEGWVILVLLGLIAKVLKIGEKELVVSPLVLVGLITIGAPLTFPYGIPESMVSLNLSVAARMGGFLIAEGILLFAFSAFRSRKKMMAIWVWPLIFLVAKAFMQLVASVSPADLWLSDHGIRILYLHVVLLGALTTGLVAYLNRDLDIRAGYFYAVLGSVIFVILTLVLLTSLWPAFLSGIWIYDVLALAAIFPVIAVMLFWLKLYLTVKKDVKQFP